MAWTPDMIMESRKFLLPLWKADGSALIEVGDSVRLLARSDDGIDKAVVVVATGISDDGRTLVWDRLATGNDPDGPIFSGDITAAHSQHNNPCPEPVNLTLADYAQGDDTVDAFTINGVVTTGDWSPLVAGDDTLLEDAMNAVLLGNGHATVTSDGTVFTFFVMNTTATITVTNVVTASPLVAF